jgi:hypothetical protein
MRIEIMRSKWALVDARIMCNEHSYSCVWEKLLQTEVDSVVALELQVKKLQSNMPQREPRQPSLLQGYKSTAAEYLELLKMEFEERDHFIFEDAKVVASQRQFVFHEGPPKKDKRSLEKARLSYADDFSRLKDLRRASIVCPSMAGIVLLCQDLAVSNLQLLRVKNRFDRKYEAEQSAGYRDLQFNVQVPGTGLVWELQVHVAAIEALKTKTRDESDATGRTGHLRYVWFRQIKEREASIILSGCRPVS